MTIPLKLITSLFCTVLISSGVISSMVWMDPSEIAYFSPPTSTMSAWMIASVNGSRMVHVLPTPILLFTSTSPLSASILDLTTSSPTPLPDISDTCFAVENPAWNSRLVISCSVMFSPCSGVMTPLLIAFSLTSSTLMPAPSSRTSITTLFPS